MSNPGSSYYFLIPSSASGRTAAPGMDLPHKYSSQSQFDEPDQHSNSMSTLTLRTSTLRPYSRNLSREDRRYSEYSPQARCLNDRAAKVELPSIRQAIPEIQLRRSRVEPEYRYNLNSSSSSLGPGVSITKPDYRRLPRGDGNVIVESRDYAASIDYQSPPGCSRSPNVGMSPKISTSRPSAFSSAESWTSSIRASPHNSAQRLPGIRSPASFDLNTNQSEWRPTLPSLPSLTLERGSTQDPRDRSNWSEYAPGATHSVAKTFPQLTTAFEPPPPSCDPQATSYGYQECRDKSYSRSSSLSFDRTPFRSGQHYPGYSTGTNPYEIEINDEMEGKQRKRRGNLPKETTDILRAWFISHLQHPYPTEDEKQELMRLTGLQMNQISNWFINARRRQLPAMINNARAESDARSARVGERGEIMSDYANERDKAGFPLGDSDGEGSYDEEFGSGTGHAIQGLPKEEIY